MEAYTPQGESNGPQAPNEIWVQVFSKLDAKSLVAARTSCRLFNQIIDGNDVVWMRACYPFEKAPKQTWKELCIQLHQNPCHLLSGKVAEMSRFLDMEELANRSYWSTFYDSCPSWIFALSSIGMCGLRLSSIAESDLAKLNLSAGAFSSAITSLGITWETRREVLQTYQELRSQPCYQELLRITAGRPETKLTNLSAHLNQFLDDLISKDPIVLGYSELNDAADILKIRESHSQTCSVELLDEMFPISDAKSYRADYAIAYRKLWLIEHGILTTQGQSAPLKSKELKEATNQLLLELRNRAADYKEKSLVQVSAFTESLEMPWSRRLRRLLGQELNLAQKGDSRVRFTPFSKLSDKLEELKQS